MFIYANGAVYLDKYSAKTIIAITTYRNVFARVPSCNKFDARIKPPIPSEVIDAYWINTGEKYSYLTYFDNTELNYFTKFWFIQLNKKKESCLIIVSGLLL